MFNNNPYLFFGTCTANVLILHVGQYVWLFLIYVDSTFEYMLNLTGKVLKGKNIFFISTVQKWFGVLETYSNVLSDVTSDFTNVLQTYCDLEIGCFKYHASILSCMQVSTYISAGDYQTLADNKPKEFETVPQFMADVLRKKAEFLRQTVGADGAPIVPQHERV